jgi:asparagine synthase (glutamine-hydrolysing)
MCGIFALLYSTITIDKAMSAFEKGSHRGPDDNIFTAHEIWLGFHRLAIQGLTNGRQPFMIDGVQLVCNGEIYNHKEMYKKMKVTPTTQSDCEVLIPMYQRYGIEHTVQRIQGSEFAFVLYDKGVCYAVRDPYGVRPLYQGTQGGMVCFASEIKMFPPGFDIKEVVPGTIVCCKQGVLETTKYCSLPAIQPTLVNPYQQIRDTLYECVKRRVIQTERPMAALLSGGLDSSLITMLVCRARIELGITEPLETYSIGLEGAEDLKFATIVANYLGTKHTTIILSEQEFLNAIPEVIYAIESRDTTTVRASVGNFLVAKYIKEHSQAKIVFNGDGSDEVCGGYLYMKRAPDDIEFDKECRRLVSDIYLFDGKRSDRCISYHGLEARTPFLDRSFVELYLSVPSPMRFTICEKELLRLSFTQALPDEILWRKKEAFSDGVSSLQRSWFSIIQENVPPSPDQNFTAEQYYYKTIYDSHFQVDVLPYYWMPKYTTTKDCSARTLENYII